MGPTPSLTRRGALGAALGLAVLPWSALAQEEALAAAIREQVGDAVPEEGGIALRVPAVAENGGQVPLGIVVESPQTQAQHVAAIHVFATRNPTPGVASFRLTPLLPRAEVQTRIRLAEDQRVVVLAQMSDGSVRRAVAEIRVATGGCLS
ncbi:thiosulfate oxidation carrier protein SoxY [Falsiroseomonas oryzae]|uniref:thiosulfate oxidation carrier protein SoxY n=1 Tax=Falsiroseomonas oryzae TaxID=2766473 RepID=UPI0022EB5FBA|nr:thiosulfate oxidation carrier protein SoxY [Roseomonas sp. MO-31]